MSKNVENLKVMFEMLRDGLLDGLPEEREVFLSEFVRRAYQEGRRDGVADTDPVIIQQEEKDAEEEGVDPMTYYDEWGCYFLENFLDVSYAGRDEYWGLLEYVEGD